MFVVEVDEIDVEIRHPLQAVTFEAVEEFTTHCFDAAMSGGRLFNVDAQLRLLDGLTLQLLRLQLEAVAADLMVDISMKSE